MFKLVIQDDEGKTTVVPLIRDELTIGRKEGNTIRLTERNVSRRHARLLRSNGSITIEDLNSYNGIRVNGSRIQGRCQIRESDRVQIGDYLIEIKSAAQEKIDTLDERTVPMERIDPHAHTPVPDLASPGNSGSVTTPMSGDPAATPFAPAVTEPMTVALADSEPAGAGLGAQPVPGAVPVAPTHARLVVLSSNFAGREFDLDKPTMVIGRTDDNDICVNHRSISRHHAKVVRENGRHSIVDLQSSNGVRVNGEEYGKVELRRADVVDLGHVRLRFVEAGEDFVFGRDAQAVDFAPAGAPRLAMWIALGLLVTGAVVALFLILSGNEKAGASRGTTAAGGESTATGRSDAAAAGQPEVSDGRDVPVPEVSDELSAQLGAARQAIENEKWVEAQQAARAALVHDPNHAESQAVLEHAKAEIAAEELYNQFTKAVNTKNYGQIATLFNQFDPESVYRVKAQPDHDRMKADYVRARSFSGKRLADRGRCREQNKLAREAGRIWPEAAEAVLSHLCKEIPGGSAGGNTGGGGGASGGGASGGGASGGAATGGAGGGGGGGTAAASGPTFDQLLDEARKAAFDGHYGKAIRSCEAALEKKPNDQEAIKTCAVAACKLKSAARAKKYLRKLTSETRQQMVRQICLQSGVTDI